MVRLEQCGLVERVGHRPCRAGVGVRVPAAGDSSPDIQAALMPGTPPGIGPAAWAAKATARARIRNVSRPVGGDQVPGIDADAEWFVAPVFGNHVGVTDVHPGGPQCEPVGRHTVLPAGVGEGHASVPVG